MTPPARQRPPARREPGEPLSGSKVIVWPAFDTLKLCMTAGAGAYTSSPGWSASTVHVPVLSKETSVPLVPLDSQESVVVLNVTARPDDADADTANGDSIS